MIPIVAWSVLRLDLFDRDTFSKDDPLGGAEVPMSALEVVDEKAFDVQLSTQGRVVFRAYWTPEGGRASAAGESSPSGEGSSAQLVEFGVLRMHTGMLGQS